MDKTKVVFFDFDGTLSYKSPNAWHIIDEFVVKNNKNGDNDVYLAGFGRFVRGECDYEEWVNTLTVFMKRTGYNYTEFKRIKQQVKPIPELKSVFETLTKNNCKIFVLSGGIREVIESTLGDSMQYVEKVFCNELLFEKDGKFKGMNATSYDYLGKAKCIEEFIKQTNTKPSEIVFVGNSSNDEWVWTTGVKTVCINPDNADFKNRKVWNRCYEVAENLKVVLPEFNFNNKFQNQIKFGNKYIKTENKTMEV